MTEKLKEKKRLGEKIIEALNKCLKCQIEINDKTIGDVESVVSDFMDEIVEGSDYGYCPDCDERMPDEPCINEGYL